MKKIFIITVLCLCGYIIPSFAGAKKLCVTVDFVDNIWKSFKTTKASPGNGIHSTKNIDQMMDIFSKLGITQVFWIYNFNDHLHIKIIDSKTKKPLPEKTFLKYLVKAAHKAGMKLFMVVKPFESVNSYAALPQPYFSMFKNNGLENLNGYYPNIESFVANNPDLRIKRKPLDKKYKRLPVTSIKLVSASSEKVLFSKQDFILYNSNTNGNFTKYNKPFTLQSGVEKRNGKKHFVLTFDNLQIPPEDKYIWIEYTGKSRGKKFYNQQNRLMELYSKGQKLPATNSIIKIPTGSLYGQRDHLRANSLDRNSIAWTMKIPAGYGKNGNIAFQFGFGPWVSRIYLDFKSGVKQGHIAACRGKMRYLNALHPVYPEVRKYWLGHLKKLIEAGVDGIDIRPDSHSTWTQEGEAYGFNKPVVDEFKKRYGIDVLKQKFDRKKWTDLQAEYFTTFLKEAKKLTDAANIKLFAHVSHLMVRYFPRKLNNLPENFSWPWKAWIKDNIVDGVTIKYVPWPWGKKKGQGKELVPEIAGFAKKYNKLVYLNVRLDCWWMELSAEQRKAFPLKTKDIKRIENGIAWACAQKQVDAINIYEANDFLLRDPVSKSMSCSEAIVKILKSLK